MYPFHLLFQIPFNLHLLICTHRSPLVICTPSSILAHPPLTSTSPPLTSIPSPINLFTPIPYPINLCLYLCLLPLPFPFFRCDCTPDCYHTTPPTKPTSTTTPFVFCNGCAPIVSSRRFELLPLLVQVDHRGSSLFPPFSFTSCFLFSTSSSSLSYSCFSSSILSSSSFSTSSSSF